ALDKGRLDLPHSHRLFHLHHADGAQYPDIRLLLESDWQQKVGRIEQLLEEGLAPCRELAQVRDVRVLGAIGVVEMKEPVAMREIQAAFVERGVWVRPFGRLVYVMPPYCISAVDLQTLTAAIVEVVAGEGQ
ncbi:MAG: aminotransferase class III-fold pyridoxal phosphate-dependent enzyme, partial [Proteobacteria bacterium]|nr:aminotransferase class III-fold pyridoxal phosphate-dependent enzyme [Pseudomonadota bacterium]